MKLLICTQKVDVSDSNLSFFHGWVEEFAKQVEHVHVICLEEGVHRLPSNVTVHSLGKEDGASRGGYIGRFIALIRNLRDQYDTVFVHMNPEYVLLGGGFWRLWGKRVGLWYTHRSTHPYVRVASYIVHIIFTASSESFRIPSKKVVVMGHGIDIEAFVPRTRPSSSQTFRLLSFGRISERKQLLPMITAVQELLVSGADLKLVIAGAPVTEEDIAYVKTLKETIASGPQPEAIDLCGPVLHEDIPKLLKNADLFLNLSETGSLDKAVLEAMASGVPVLTSNEGLRSTLAKTVPECFMNDASELPTRIQKFLDMPSEDRVLLGKRLRDMVLSEHSRSDLIRRIIIGLHS